jgi:hypothetical protein
MTPTRDEPTDRRRRLDSPFRSHGGWPGSEDNPVTACAGATAPMTQRDSFRPSETSGVSCFARLPILHSRPAL